MSTPGKKAANGESRIKPTTFTVGQVIAALEEQRSSVTGRIDGIKALIANSEVSEDDVVTPSFL